LCVLNKHIFSNLAEQEITYIFKKPKIYYLVHSTTRGPYFVPCELSPQLHKLLIYELY